MTGPPGLDHTNPANIAAIKAAIKGISQTSHRPAIKAAIFAKLT